MMETGVQLNDGDGAGFWGGKDRDGGAGGMPGGATR